MPYIIRKIIKTKNIVGIKEGIIVINVKRSPFEYDGYVGYSGAICVVVLVYDCVCCTGTIVGEGVTIMPEGMGLSHVVYHFSEPD